MGGVPVNSVYAEVRTEAALKRWSFLTFVFPVLSGKVSTDVLSGRTAQSLMPRHAQSRIKEVL